MFEVRNLSFSYSGREVLRDVSFVVSPGEIVSVVGRNGAGKTTLLKILSTLAYPDGGHFFLDGQDAFSNQIKYRRQIGYMPEHTSLYDEMSVKDYLYYRAAIKGEMKKRIRRRVGEAMEICRLTECAKCAINTLSFGMRRRISLADAILLRPRVLLLDDFFAGLDRTLRIASGEILSAVASFSAVIVTGHEIEDLAKWTTRFEVLKNASICATIPSTGIEIQKTVDRVDTALKESAL
jgi:ABC-2 type transport system ATP-binding protein